MLKTGDRVIVFNVSNASDWIRKKKSGEIGTIINTGPLLGDDEDGFWHQVKFSDVESSCIYFYDYELKKATIIRKCFKVASE